MTTDRVDDWDGIADWLERWRTADHDERERLREQLIAERGDRAEDVLSLARTTERLGGFLETPAMVVAAKELAPGEAEFPPGTMIGPYEVISFLARGGMGDVYRARDPRLERPVALKVLSQTRTSDPRLVARFINEARMTASLDHPNIVRVFDIGVADGYTYLVAELLEGETLRSRIERGPIDADDVARLGIAIARGLSAAHAAGLVHRDLKPENVFLTRSGETKILDFGIAKLAQDENVRDGLSTLTGVVLGTTGYLSPEQIRGGAVDHRADLFALGTVLFEMLTGRRAFTGPHLVDVLHSILHDDPLNATGDQSVPAGFAIILDRLLEKSADARFQTADDVITALEHRDQSLATNAAPRARRQALASRPVVARPSRARQALLVTAVVATSLVIAALYWSPQPGVVGASAPRVTLAVMPFRSIPAGSENDVLALGLADVLISRLSQIANIRVLPATATERLKQLDPLDAARQLSATHVLSVTLQRDGERVRAVPRLIAQNGEAIWSTTIDSESGSTFTVQDVIVTKVIDELTPQLPSGVRKKLAQSGTRNSAAFEAYATGRAYVLNPTRDDLARAKDAFETALKLDDHYADAWAGLGSAYKRMPIGAGTPGAEAFPQAKAAALRALELDPNHAEAHSVLGTVAFWYDWDYARAEKELRRSLELQPSSADSLLFLAHLHANIGRSDEALAEIAAARAFDPEWLLARAQEGHFLFLARRYDDAVTSLDATLKIAPRFWPAHQMRLLPLVALERWDEALQQIEMRSALASETGNDGSVGFKGYILARQGRRADAEAVLGQIRAMQPQRRNTSEALVLHALGRDDEAIASLQRVIDVRGLSATFLAVHPFWDDLRANAAFRNILKQVNLLDVSDRIKPPATR